MSKAEEKSLKAYPQKIEWVGNQWDGAPFDVNSKSRSAYKQGYHQAEKDLELTWKNIMAIDDLLEELLPPKRISDEFALKGYYQEVLKRFKERKETKF